MSDSIIVAENISKRYRLGFKSQREKTLAAQLMNIVKAPLDNLRYLTSLSKFGKEDDSVFWALKDINFQVKKGEVLGIIGKNGAGKSTLLKILSRITDPTGGTIKIQGRVASLLEVGTGFHPELTGRENVYMNGTILGMRRKEIDKKFTEIVEFSGVEKFIDTPVKFYSSGMKVRLGFAVAAHLEPEILVVDEVLAVGDVEFQAKCLGKMEDVSKNQGRTVLFVSHNMAAVQNLCTRALLLSKGSVIKDGAVGDIINSYLNDFFGGVNGQSLKERSDRQGSGVLKFEDAWFEDANGKRIDTTFSGTTVFMVMQVLNTTTELITETTIAVGIDDSQARRLFVFNNELTNQKIQVKPSERLEIRIKVDPWPLQGDTYHYTLFSSVRGAIADWIFNAGKIIVENGDYFKTGRVVPRGQGSILIDHEYIY